MADQVDTTVVLPDLNENELLQYFLSQQLDHLGTVVDNESNESQTPRGAGAAAAPDIPVTVASGVPDVLPPSGDDVPSVVPAGKDIFMSEAEDMAPQLPAVAGSPIQSIGSPEQHLPHRSPMLSGGAGSAPQSGTVPSTLSRHESQQPIEQQPIDMAGMSKEELLALLERANAQIVAPADIVPPSLRQQMMTPGAVPARPPVEPSAAPPVDASGALPTALDALHQSSLPVDMPVSSYDANAFLAPELQQELQLSMQQQQPMQHDAAAADFDFAGMQSSLPPVPSPATTSAGPASIATVIARQPGAAAVDLNAVRVVRRKAKKERNRISAQESRKRKKMYVANLEATVQSVQNENTTLHRKVQDLTDENVHLREANNRMREELTRLRDAFTHSGPVSSLVANLNAMQKTAEAQGSGIPFKPSAPATMLIVLFAFALLFQPPNDSLHGDMPPLFAAVDPLTSAASAALPATGRKLASIALGDDDAVDAELSPSSSSSPGKTFFCGGGVAGLGEQDALAAKDAMSIMLPARIVNATLAKELPGDAMVKVDASVVDISVVEAAAESA